MIVLEKMPKTRSGKTLRGTMTKILNKEKFKVPATIDDITTLEIL